MQPADLAVTLRRRTPWEAADLGLAMLQLWWRPVFAAHALVFLPIAALCLLAGWMRDSMALALLLLWWLEPVYDRVVLHVLSRAVFGAVPAPRAVVRSAPEWLKTGLFAALTWDRIDFSRSFNLPVRQLEGQRGREARERRSILGRRTRGYAVWLTIVWLHFEIALWLSAGSIHELLLPAQLERARGAEEPFLGGFFEILQLITVEDALAYAAVLLFLEPFYVAAGFALYLNRRTLLEGWDIEVALRGIAARHAAVLAAVCVAAALLFPPPALAQDRSPKKEIAEVMKAPEFGHYRETMQWQAREARSDGEIPWYLKWLLNALKGWQTGSAFAKAVETLMWGAAALVVAYALWWLSRMLPRAAPEQREAYRPPPALFGMELAPDKLPPDVAGAATVLAREGRLREALSLLYRGALSELVHRRGVELLPGHTEGEAVRLAGLSYFASLVDAWRRCAYARRNPSPAEVEQLASGYRAAFAP